MTCQPLGRGGVCRCRPMPVPVQALLVTLIVTRVSGIVLGTGGVAVNTATEKRKTFCSSVGSGYQMRHEIKKVEGSRCHREGLSREANRVRWWLGIATYKLERSGKPVRAEPCEYPGQETSRQMV